MIPIDVKDNDLNIPQRSIAVENEYDVIVVGGGIAGVAAGMAAGKRGCSTLIIEASSALGGLATMGLVNIPLDFVSGLGIEMFRILTEVNGLWHRNTDPEKHKLVLDRMVKKYNCDVLLVTAVVDAIVKNDTICGVVIQTKTGQRAIMAKRVIDCSGDSDISYYAGAELMQGRTEDGMSQSCSMEFTLGGVNWDEYNESELKKNDPRWVQLIIGDLKSGELAFEVDNHKNWITHVPGRPEHCGMDEISLCFAHSRSCFPVNHHDLTRMYFEGREQADMLAKYIKRRIPGFQNSYLIATAPLLGVRESRRIVGEYVLTARDLASSQKFDDVICISTHGYDLHNFEGPGNIKWAPIEIQSEIQYVICNRGGYGTTTPPPDNKELVNIKGERAEAAEFEQNVFYDIPYRCLVPVKIDNLLAAGRNLSSDIYAQSGARLIMGCFNMGEAAGTAAAISLKENTSPGKIDRITLQRELIANNANIGQQFRTIPGLAIEDNFEDSFRNHELNTNNLDMSKDMDDLKKIYSVQA